MVLAREQVALLIGCEPAEIVFTGGGTESNNTALHAALAMKPHCRHVVTTAVEHPSVRNLCRGLEEQGYGVTWVPVSSEGELDLDRLGSALQQDTAVVSVMTANNETGVIFPVAAAAALARSCGVLFHTDAVQAVGKIGVDAHAWGCDFLSAAAHKFHGPKGVGALFVRRGHRPPPYLVGGDQERGRRAGTENVAGIVGMGTAATEAAAHLAAMGTRVRRMRERLEAGLRGALPNVRIAGAKAERLPNTTCMVLEAAESEPVLDLLDLQGICCSSGSACATGSGEPSHVLQAMGFPPERCRSAVRLSLSRFTTEKEIDSVVPAVADSIRTVERRTRLPRGCRSWGKENSA
jgi:cysteine desulfurase